MIFCSWWGITFPTVDTRASRESSTSVMLQTGEVSVMPQAMVSCSQCISVSTRFITSIGQGAPAMKRGAPLLGDRLQGVERTEVRGGQDHGRAVRHAGQVAQHHAEAVIKRHGDAEPIPVAQAHALAHTEAVVEDVVVGEHSALGKARGAGGVL